VLNAKLKPVWSDEERGADRYRLLLEAQAGLPEAGTQAVRIHDLSATGFLLEAEAALDIGAEVSLDIPGAGAAVGDIVWSSGAFAGGQFRSPLAADALAAARSGSRVIWPDFVPTSVADRSPDIAPSPEEVAPTTAPADGRWPIGARVRFIVGSSLVLWSALALGLALAFG